MQSNLIIPLAGYGRKFSNNGYKILKPFLNIDKKNRMIDLIIKNFPKKIKKIFIVRSNLERKYINILKKYENSKIYFIKPHTNGPLYSLNSISDKLINLKKIFISYCDINWTWIKQSKINTNYNYVFCYKGYHPFTEDNNNYAFCKAKYKSLIKIKEKDSFTNNWQNEPLSIGLFYFSSGYDLVKSNNLVIDKNIRVNNEYFPSISFNFIDKKKIQFVKSFSHVGNPQYYEIFKKWKNYHLNKKNFLKDLRKYNFADEIIIPAAGNSQRFLKEKIITPKYLIKLDNSNHTMIELIKNYLNSKNKIKLITLKKTKKLNNKFELITLKNKTHGQADTVLKILNKISPNSSLYINSCDTFSIFNLKKFSILKKKSDIIVFATNNFETDSSTTQGSWVKFNKYNKINKIYLKSKNIRNTSRLTGNFYFKNKEIFMKCFNISKNKMINNEIYIDTLINGAIKLKYNVNVMLDHTYINMGTPKLLKEFNYWNNCFE